MEFRRLGIRKQSRHIYKRFKGSAVGMQAVGDVLLHTAAAYG